MNNDPIQCSEDELVQQLRLSIAIEIVPVPDDPNAQTNVGLVSNYVQTMPIMNVKPFLLCVYSYICRQQMNSLMSMQDSSIQQLLKATTTPLLLWLPLLTMQSGL